MDKIFGEVLDYEQPTKYIVESTLYNDLYETPVLTAGQTFILGYTSEKENIYTNLPCIIFDDFTTAIKYVDFPFKVKSSAMKILTIIDNNVADIKYLYYKMSTTSVDISVHKRYWISNYSQIRLTLPSLPEQQKIAGTLDKLLQQISRRNRQLEKISDLINVKFIEMFGDPVKNPKNWDIEPFYKRFDFFNGKAHEQEVSDFGQYIIVNAKFIATNGEVKKFSNEQFFPLYRNDIVMVMSDVPNGRAIAKCYLIEQDNLYTLNQRICAIRGTKYNHVFAFYLLNRHKHFLSFDNGNSQTNLRKEDILSCPLIIPPRPLQDDFAKFVHEIEKTKTKIQQSLEKLENCYKALMQEYFG